MAVPFASDEEEEGVALALSGGGYRAMLFHLGAVIRINELGLLGGLSRISAVSGGSILLGRLAVRWKHLRFTGGCADNLFEEVAQPVLDFSKTLLDARALALGLLTPLSSSRIAARFYERLVGKATLHDLPDQPDAPRFVFNSSHLATATSWRFSKPYMGSYRIGLIYNPDEKVATAIAASAAFPPFLSPLTLKPKPESFTRVEGADHYDTIALRKTVALSDGGVYDNLGLQTVQKFTTILSSDAGGLLTVRPGAFRFWPQQLMRVYDTASEQARALRRRILFDDFTSGRKKGTMWSTWTDLARNYPHTPIAVPVDPSWRLFLAGIRTRLNPFSEEERSWLVNWGYVVSDVALRTWVVKDVAPPAALPFPNFGFAQPRPGARQKLAGDFPADA